MGSLTSYFFFAAIVVGGRAVGSARYATPSGHRPPWNLSSTLVKSCSLPSSRIAASITDSGFMETVSVIGFG